MSDPIKAMSTAARLSEGNGQKAESIAIEYKGRYCIATGHHQMSEEFFKKSFPNGIFCQVIGFDINKGFKLRCWMKGKKYHSYKHPKRLKWI